MPLVKLPVLAVAVAVALALLVSVGCLSFLVSGIGNLRESLLGDCCAAGCGTV
ncbi:hypothetical protein PC116_g31648 [Phytophthora cactorum]|nr:hypothetical protein PC116_g31648 [Phytophthora cactorum]